MSAPNAVGTGGGATAGALQTAYPMNANNGSDVWESTGATVYSTVPIIAPAATATQILAATTGKKIKVVAFTLSATGAAGTAQFQDETGTPVKESGVYGCLQNTAIIAPFNPAGWITTASGAALDLLTVGASAVFGGTLTYCLV